MAAIRTTNAPKIHGRCTGSALILTVVLTSLLALVGVLFVMAARIDKMASSATSENSELNFAIDTLVAQISETLVEDVPGVSDVQEYYDYPDANDPWLANLEPYELNGQYYWRQISNIAGVLTGDTQDVLINVIGGHDTIADSNVVETTADADGDGVGDSQWFQVPGIMSSKGLPMYAAVRIVDNGGMLNVNTGYKFDANNPNAAAVDGTSQLQVNVLALAAEPGLVPTIVDEAALLGTRANYVADISTLDMAEYERMVTWRYEEPATKYTPFDLSDELELRYRYLLNHRGIDTRVENWGWFKSRALSTPVDSNGVELDRWFGRAQYVGLIDPNYAYRHIATTYNMDRILTPKEVPAAGVIPRKMVNVNAMGEEAIRGAVLTALLEKDPNFLGAAETAIQLTANLRDYIDDDNEVTVIGGGSSPYYGFERPCIYISEIAYRFVVDQATGAVYRSYAVELHKPYFEDGTPPAGTWQLVIDNLADADVQQVVTWSGSRRFHILRLQHASAPLAVAWQDPNEAAAVARVGFTPNNNPTPQVLSAGFSEGATVMLRRQAAGNWVTVDYWKVPGGWMAEDGQSRSIQRDISPHKCIRRLWTPAAEAAPSNLGGPVGQYVDTSKREIVQAYPANQPLTTIGELGMVFAESAYGVSAGERAEDLLVDLRNAVYARLFNYLTVIDPAGPPARGLGAEEMRIKGRVNLNTAPWFVLGQLPWIQHKDNVPFEKARAMVAYRDQVGPYKSTADVMQVVGLHELAYDRIDNQHTDAPRGPDLTPDTAQDDMEERDLLFSRISNLVTVRSDVFTAYILARIGVNGAQRRMVAIFDRSGVLTSNDNVRLVALFPVPDPR